MVAKRTRGRILRRRGKGYGVQTGDIRIDMERVRQRKKRAIVDSFSETGSQGAPGKRRANLDLNFLQRRKF